MFLYRSLLIEGLKFRAGSSDQFYLFLQDLGKSFSGPAASHAIDSFTIVFKNLFLISRAVSMVLDKSD